MPPSFPSTRIDLASQPIWFDAAGTGAGDEIVLQLYAETLHYVGDYQLVGAVSRIADDEGTAHFRLDPMLEPLLQSFAPTSLTTTTRSRTNILNYYLRWGVAPAPGAAPTSWTESSLRTALRGAVSPTFGDYFAWLEGQAVRPFMTWLPPDTVLSAGQPGWLFWLCPADTATVLKVRRRYLVGTERSTQWETASLASIPDTNYVLLAIPLRSGLVVDAETLDITVTTTGGVPLSEVFTFRLDANPPGRSRYFLFCNSLGCLDVLRTDGRYENNLEAKMEVAIRPGLSATTDERQLISAQTVSDRDKVWTGFLSKKRRQWLKELILTKDVWEWRDGQFVPVVIVKKTLSIPSPETPGLVGTSFELESAATVRGYADPGRVVVEDDGSEYEIPPVD